MKSVLLPVAFLFFISVNAQKDLARITGYSFHEFDDAPQQIAPKRNEFIKGHKISSQTRVRIVGKFTSKEITLYNEKGYVLNRKYTSSDGWDNQEIYTYNDQNYVTSKQLNNSKGEVLRTTNYEYNSNNKLTKIVETTSKKTETWMFEYDANGNRISESGLDRKGKFYLRKKKYDLNTNKILVSELYSKDTTDAIKRLEYSYYEDGNKKSIHYFEKNKLIYTWNFDCAPEGELVDLKKTDSTLVCIKKETDAEGNEIVWRHEFNSTGIPVKIKSVYSTTGKLKEEISYRADGTIYNQKTFFPDGGFVDLYFDKEGKESWSIESFYNTQGQMIKFSSIYSKKYFKHIWYSYNEQGLISLQTEVSKKRTIVEEYTYTFFE